MIETIFFYFFPHVSRARTWEGALVYYWLVIRFIIKKQKGKLTMLLFFVVKNKSASDHMKQMWPFEREFWIRPNSKVAKGPTSTVLGSQPVFHDLGCTDFKQPKAQYDVRKSPKDAREAKPHSVESVLVSLRLFSFVLRTKINK